VQEEGGVSGRPLTARSTEIIRALHRLTGGRVPIIGVGGIFNAADAREKLEAGASLLYKFTPASFTRGRSSRAEDLRGADLRDLFSTSA
jgi:dihydroorotate dehydrogenase